MSFPNSGRRDTAQAALPRQWFNQQVLPTFHGRILAVDEDVALRCGRLICLTHIQCKNVNRSVGAPSSARLAST